MITATERLLERLESDLEAERADRRALSLALERVMRNGGEDMKSKGIAIEALRCLAASWERLGCHEAAKDALRRAEKLAKALEAAA